MGKVNTLWQSQLESLEQSFIDGMIDIDDLELALERLVPLDEIGYFVDAAMEARADHDQFGVGA